jgi:hypothetical protein
MEINVFKKGETEPFKFDTFLDSSGNCYISGLKNKNDKFFSELSTSLLYQINITGNNGIRLDEEKPDILSESIENIFGFQQTKILDITENDTETYLPEDGDHINTYLEQEDTHGFFGDENLNEKEGDHYIFSSSGSGIKVPVYKSDEEMSLYETFMYDDSRDITALIFKSEGNEVPIFRLRVYSSGKIVFRPTGEKEKEYILGVDPDGTLILITPKFIEHD